LPWKWLGNVTELWYGPTVTGSPLPVSVHVPPAATHAPFVVLPPTVQVPFVFGRPEVSCRWHCMQRLVMTWPRFVFVSVHLPPASTHESASVAYAFVHVTLSGETFWAAQAAAVLPFGT
jgi:hypothetical protein